MAQPVAATRAARVRYPTQIMRQIPTVLLVALGVASLATVSASAAPDDPIGDLIAHSVAASESPDRAHSWKPGEQVGYEAWSAARSVDYRQYGLRPPPLGYEWRETDRQYVLAKAASGLIVAVEPVR